MGESLSVGILELGPASNAVVLAPHIAELGFDRYWFSEHYSRGQSADPLAAAAAAGAMVPDLDPDTGLRLGTAGVLLPFTTPEAIVARCSVATSVRPAPFDLGVAFAASGDAALDAALLDGRPPPTALDLEHRLTKLRELVDDLARVDEPARDPWLLGPPPAHPVDLWLCGSSERSAAIAARVGFNYAFHAGLAADETDGAAVVAGYRSAFRASWDRTPHVVVADFAAPGREVEHLAIAGDRSRCARAIDDLASTHNTDQIVLALWDSHPVVALRGIREIANIVRSIS